MSQQPELFYDDFQDALRYAIKALGGFEAVGADLWPGKTRKQAGNWLSDCLNPERAAKLDIGELVELLRMARAAGIHSAMNQLADDVGYEKPKIAPAVSEEQKLAAEMQRCVDTFKRLAEEADALRQHKVAEVRRLR